MEPISSYLGPVYFLSEFALLVFKRAKAGSGSIQDQGSSRVLWLLIMPSVALAYQFQYGWPAAGWPRQPWIDTVAVVTMIVALALRWYSIIYLGRFFTVNVAIAADHQLIDGGPYRWLRHPSYTGALLAFDALGLSMQNWASLAVLIVGPTAAFLYRMRIEEVALTGAFGDRYRQYIQRTWRLVPGVY
jgi:protein-S-isoprenylcysteine O-methyltransferase